VLSHLNNQARQKKKQAIALNRRPGQLEKSGVPQNFFA
jgi:hypothetical protein